ncbi:23S rRNA (adenine(2030)-N(6))-methyltransferase RlmJ [Saccharospirillum mangrovi]|uniref:23S rRNA (adenine(2030)-N(6))-methyltransferase RlmJ n=1 Tax=Saccharospirillum mangrovi TaxID=2161747 RepID=UPI000D384D0D|nr:23S rRNA (adenine(2030)-N(6))-methyltransferase RlmJ [Saccharospirillum mangrovi]
MLSYRHAFHAGNHADMLKHLTLALCADYLTRKPKPLVYVDTHAGAGAYRLTSNHAQKKREFETGIGVLNNAPNPPEEVRFFLDALTKTGLDLTQMYPGSPLLAASLLNSDHRLQLFELHPSDFPILQQQFRGDRRVRCYQRDGFDGLLSAMPPKERRALVLIDPPYEIKTDYDQVAETLATVTRKFPQLCALVWYPIAQRERSDTLVRKLKKLSAEWLVAELNVAPDSDDYGMTGSGMFVLNPPYLLAEQLRNCLPWLSQQLSAEGFFQLDAQSG